MSAALLLLQSIISLLLVVRRSKPLTCEGRRGLFSSRSWRLRRCCGKHFTRLRGKIKKHAGSHNNGKSERQARDEKSKWLHSVCLQCSPPTGTYPSRMRTTTLSVTLGLVISARCLSSRAHAFVIGQPRAPTRTRETSISHATASDCRHRRSSHVPHNRKPTAATNLYAQEVNADLDSTDSIPTTIERYECDGWSLTYRYRPAPPGHEDDEPLVLVHPVGIGCSSWIWTKMAEEWKGGAIYAPNLIGCGLEDGNDAWDPDTRGLSVPLAWVKAVEALIQERVLAPPAPSTSTDTKNGCTVVVQGGSAPIGVLLASRNPSVVSHLVLTSPPTWEDMTTATPEEELAKNYNFYRSFRGKLAFGVLESRWAVRLFSNLFLFLEECDELWVDLSTSEEATTVEARPPVAIFNSGFLQHRSYEEELGELEQPVLIISGSGDKRAEKRKKYGSEMKRCSLKTLRGTNVLPWEAPNVVCEAIQLFCQETRI